MSKIALEWIVSGVHVDAVSVVLADSAAVFGIKRNDTDAVLVASGTAVSHDGLGLYSYDTSLLDPTVYYTAVWKVTTTDWPVQYVQEIILPVRPGQCSLAELEREVARRIGPFEWRTAGAQGGTRFFDVPGLKSSLDLGGYEDKYILRRGVMKADGAPIVGFHDDDRVRIIASYDHDDALLEADRDYAVAPANGEAIEIHYLDPEQELRPLVQATLASRVKLTDRYSVKLPNAKAQQDITALMPWITEPTQLYEISSAFSNSYFVPFLVNWWKPFMQAGSVWAAMAPIPWPNSVLVDHWRYAASLVNGAYSADGPTADNDLLHVNLYYAAAATHEYGFLYGNVRPRIFEAARSGLYISQPMATQVFEDEAHRHFKPQRRRNMVPSPGIDANLVVNGPTLAV